MISVFESTKTNTRGNYVCLWCPKSWKRMDAEFIENHVRRNHLEEYIESQYKGKIDRLERENRELREKAKPKPAEPKKEYYQCVLYCKVENRVFKAGMPKGVLVENVTCSNCGCRSLVITNNDPSWMI